MPYLSQYYFDEGWLKTMGVKAMLPNSLSIDKKS